MPTVPTMMLVPASLCRVRIGGANVRTKMLVESGTIERFEVVPARVFRVVPFKRFSEDASADLAFVEQIRLQFAEVSKHGAHRCTREDAAGFVGAHALGDLYRKQSTVDATGKNLQ